jgi:hypothetical protein
MAAVEVSQSESKAKPPPISFGRASPIFHPFHFDFPLSKPKTEQNAWKLLCVPWLFLRGI